MAVLIFIDGSFNWPIKSGKHYLARLLSLNRNVVCFDRPSFRNLLRIIVNPLGFSKKESGHLTNISSFSIWPGSQNHLLADKLNFNINFILFKLIYCINNSVVISFTPEVYLICKFLLGKKIYYYVVDDYPSYPLWNSKKSRKNFLLLERQFLRICTGIIVSSSVLYDKYKKMHKNVLYFPNPAPVAEFLVRKSKVAVPSDIINVRKPVVGFIGGLESYRIDIKLIEELIKTYPEFSFVFVGPVDLVRKKSGVKWPESENLHYLGIKPHETLYGYVKKFDVGIIPYRINNYGKACFPMKLFEYLALGKPVVTTALPSINHLAGKGLIYWSKNNRDFISNVKKAMREGNRQAISKVRMKIALKNDWKKRIADFNKFVFMKNK